MPSHVPAIAERLAWEGALSLQSTVACGAALALLAAWSLWRERLAVGDGWVIGLFFCRMAAFACALWMIAGPTQLRIERRTSPQSIAVFADGSESMDVVDPPDAISTARWTLASQSPGTATAAGDCDRLELALGVAISQGQQCLQTVGEHGSVEQLRKDFGKVRTTIARAADHSMSVASQVDESSFSERALKIGELLSDDVREACDRVTTLLDSSDKSATGDSLAGEVDQLLASLTSARQRASVLSDDLMEHYASSLSENRMTADTITRREWAGRALDAFEAKLTDDLKETVGVRRFRFDAATTPLGTERSWSQSLQDTSPAIQAASNSVNSMSATATNLSDVLRQVAAIGADESVRLAIILSDGRHNAAEESSPQDVAAALGDVPLYIVPIGNTVQVRDLLLHRVEAPTAVNEGDSAVIEAVVTATGCDGERSALVLRHDGQEVDRKPLAFAGDQVDLRVRFDVPATELGWQEYLVEVEAVDDEANPANNFMPASFEVVQDKIRVLLADGIGRWEYRYLNQLFRRETHVEFEELLFLPRLHGTGALAQRPQFPRDVEGWAKYDVVILGDVGPDQLSADSQAALDDFVRTRGGRLIVIAGREAMPAAFQDQPLMTLLPVERTRVAGGETGYGLELTDEGQFNSALMIADDAMHSREAWQEIYRRFPVYTLSEYSRPKPTARTLIQASPQAAGAVRSSSDAGEVEHAFLSWHRVGAGRVAYVAAPETFRLRFRRGDRMYHRFWGQFLRWMTATETGSGSDLVRLQTDQSQYAENEVVEITVWLKDGQGRPLAGESIEAEAKTFDAESTFASLKADAEAPGRYHGSISGLPAGAYQIAVRGKVIETLMPADVTSPVQATITVRAGDSVEMLNTQCNRALLEQLAQITGGQVIPPTAIGEVVELASFTPQETERVERTLLWNRWRYLVVIAGCLITEWIVRKSKGLV